MIEAISIYSKERLKSAQLIGSAVFLMVLSFNSKQLDIAHVVLFCFLLPILVLLRLYDDLMQKEYDAAKPKRAYLRPEYYQKLVKVIVVYTLIFLGIVFLYDPLYAAVLGGFVVFNHLVYVVLLRWPLGAWILPLFKYPLLYACVQCAYWDAMGEDLHVNQLLLSSLSIFLAFIAFDLMDEGKVAIYWPLGIQALSFSALVFSAMCTMAGFWLCLALFLYAVVYALLKFPAQQYLFLLLLIILKINML
jgi:hypothetical protein